MRLLLALALLAAACLAQNPPPASQGLLVDCNPKHRVHTEGLVNVRGNIFDRERRRHGSVAANYFFYDSSWEGRTPYLHFCLLPTEQAVAWARSFHAGITPDYVSQVWGTPSRASEKRWEYWLPNGWALLNWKDGALDSVSISTAKQGASEGKLERSFAPRNAASWPDTDTFGRVAPAAAPAAVAGTAAAVPVARSSAGPTPAAKREVSLVDAQSLAIGSARADLLLKLGEPHQRSAITGEDGVRETLTYNLQGGGTYRFRLVQGKVVEASKL